MKKILVITVALILTFAFTSCSQKIRFAVSSVVPAARGFVKVKKDDNSNYLIQVHISDLAEVKRLQDLKQAYIVWMVNDNNETKSIGQITSGKTFMRGKLKADFETVSVLKPRKIFITAEENAAVQYPNNEIILTTADF